jgi:hypothetical protein
MMIKLYNPQRLIVSGEGALLREYLREPVNQVISREVFPEMLEGHRTMFAEYDPNGAAVGAGLLAMTRLINSRIRAALPVVDKPQG